MKTVVNPDWINAPYEMSFQAKDGKLIKDSMPHRFDTPWPEDITSDKLWQWVQENSIPIFISMP